LVSHTRIPTGMSCGDPVHLKSSSIPWGYPMASSRFRLYYSLRHSSLPGSKQNTGTPDHMFRFQCSEHGWRRSVVEKTDDVWSNSRASLHYRHYFVPVSCILPISSIAFVPKRWQILSIHWNGSTNTRVYKTLHSFNLFHSKMTQCNLKFLLIFKITYWMKR
jgi:hypothetical protein